MPKNASAVPHDAEAADRRLSTSRSSRYRRAAVLLFLVAATGALPSAGSPAGLSSVLWFDKGLDVVGGPVAGGGQALVYVAGPGKHVWLDAIDPHTGTIVWKQPENFSAIASGQAIFPYVEAGELLALLPVAGKEATPLVKLAFIDAATGKVGVQTRDALYVDDAPFSCPLPLGKSAFCVGLDIKPPTIVAYTAHPPTARPVAKGIFREISRPGLFQSNAKPSRFVGLEAPGGVRWSRTVTKLFGDARYDPGNGWDFDAYGRLYVGSVGSDITHDQRNLGVSETIAISQATGAVVWRRRGLYQCGTSFVDTAFLCLMTGTISNGKNGGLRFSSGSSLTLEGFAPETGRVTWTVHVTDIEPIYDGEAPLLDSTHVLITTAGRQMVLDMRRGRLSKPTSNEVFWCGHQREFTTLDTSNGGEFRHREGTDQFWPCNAAGEKIGSAGARQSSLVGTVIAGVFVWPEPDGLRAVRS